MLQSAWKNMGNRTSAGKWCNKCLRTALTIPLSPIKLRSCFGLSLSLSAPKLRLSHCICEVRRNPHVFIHPAPETCCHVICLKSSAVLFPRSFSSAASTEHIFSEYLYFQFSLHWASLMTSFKIQVEEYFWKCLLQFLPIALVSSLLGREQGLYNIKSTAQEWEHKLELLIPPTTKSCPWAPHPCVSRDTNSISSLGSPFQSFTILGQKKFFLVSNLSLP